MTTTQLLRIVEERGLRITMEDGHPVLCRSKKCDAVTDTLLKVLKHHRERIIEILTGVPRPRLPDTPAKLLEKQKAPEPEKPLEKPRDWFDDELSLY